MNLRRRRVFLCSRGTFLTDDENEKRCSAPQPAGECVGMSRYAEKLYGAKAPLGNVGQITLMLPSKRIHYIISLFIYCYNLHFR